MVAWFDLVPDFAYDALFINEEGFTFDAHILFAIHVLLTVDSVELGDDLVSIGKQRERQAIFVGELLVRSYIVGTDAQDDDPLFLHDMVRIAERARFLCAAWGIIFWIEV